MVRKICLILMALSFSPFALAGEHGGEAKKSAETKLDLNDIVVPVLLREEVQAYYSLSMAIEPKEESKKATLLQFGPRIRDAIIHELYVILPLIWSKDDQPNMEMIKKRLESVAQKASPEDTIGLVTINSFQLNDAKDQGLDSDKK